MTALYALPDHEVVMDLIPRIGQTHLGNDEAVVRIHAVAGMVPLAIDPGTQDLGARVLWADLGDYPFREWQYTFTIEALAKQGAIGEAFTTDFAILQDPRILADPIPPQGLMFHISRCGSTLTAKALARSPRHVVINQGAPLQRGFWAALTNDFTRPLEPSEANLTAFRNLVLAMTRRRQPGQERAFVKFISWNALYMDFAMRAFPAAPALFLYRNPVEVIASVLRETSAVMWAKGRPQAGFLADCDWQATVAMDDIEYLARCFAHYLRTARDVGERVALVNYTAINPQNFPAILERGLGFVPAPDELALMLEQFQFHSKDDGDKQQFVADSAAKRAEIAANDQQRVADLTAGLMEQLDMSPANLFANPLANPLTGQSPASAE